MLIEWLVTQIWLLVIKVLYESTPISKILWHYISGVLLELFILYFRQWTVCYDDMNVT